MNDLGQVSPDGMWKWDGSNWQPTRAQQDLPHSAQSVEMVSAVEPVVHVLGDARLDKRMARAAEKEQQAAEKERARADSESRRAAGVFAQSPVGRARTAFDAGDEVFQYSINVMNQQAIIAIMIGSATAKTTSDPSEVLNAVCREGWELINGSFVFVEEGQQSRDKFASSGQNVAIKGATYGYYLFRRNEALRRTPEGS